MLAPDPTALVSAVEAHGGSRTLADSIIAEARRVHDTSQGELSDARVLAAEIGDIPVVCLPELEGEVSDLTSLDALRGYLFSAARVPFGDLTR